MTDRNARIAATVEALGAGPLSLHVIVARAFADYAPAAAVAAALATVRVAERRGLIRTTQVRHGGTYHEVLELAA